MPDSIGNCVTTSTRYLDNVPQYRVVNVRLIDSCTFYDVEPTGDVVTSGLQILVCVQYWELIKETKRTLL